MPTYEYRCTSCGHEFEVFQKMTDPPKKRCPQCRGKVEKKLSAGAGLLFKGSGFYITDYRSEDYKKKARSESAGGSSSDDKSAGKPADKPSPNGGKKSGPKPAKSDS